MGNDTALSVPLAIDAGLGELGRNGLLITPEYGACVRLCKIFTDLPLEADRPVEFGLAEICQRCRKCAEACEVEAISSAAEPSYEIACKSNNRGIRRWAVNADKCYSFWVRNGASCSTCIAVCPFTK
jgi:epoxyqueuosine reductase QueG